MKKHILIYAISGALFALSINALAEDAAPAAAPAAPASPWTITTNINFVSDYYYRGISQTWHKPAVQGGLDVAHSSGFYAGTWFSNVSDKFLSNGSLEVDYYGGYNGTFPGESLKDFGWTVGGYGYYYPGAHYNLAAGSEDYNSFEFNAGLSYKWLSAKVSVMASDFFGVNKTTGWSEDTGGSTYLELNANYPLPNVDGVTLVGHVGHYFVPGHALGVAAGIDDSADYTEWKVGAIKNFKVANADGFMVGAFFQGTDSSGDSDFWGKNGFGGLGKSQGNNRLIVQIGRTF